MTSKTTKSRPPRRVAVIGAALVIYLGTAALFVAVTSSILGVSRRGGGALFGERIAIVELEGPLVDADDEGPPLPHGGGPPPEGEPEGQPLESQHGPHPFAAFFLLK